MKYFVTDLNKHLSILDWDMDMSDNPAFEVLTQEQLDFMEQYPDATAYLVYHLIAPPPPPTPELLLELAKQHKIDALIEYDSSPAVNEFFIGNTSLWLDKDTRAGLILRFNAELTSGKTSTTLWYGTLAFTLPVATAIQMLYAVEIYASSCYDNTAQHKANIEALETIEAVESYDYETGYPEKLNFEI